MLVMIMSLTNKFPIKRIKNGQERCPHCKGVGRYPLPNMCDPLYITVPEGFELISSGIRCKYCQGRGIANSVNKKENNKIKVKK